MERKTWKIRAGRDGKYWPIWKDEKIISVGWDIGNVKEKDYDWNETKELIERKYPNKDSTNAARCIRTIAGMRDDDKHDMEKGDIIVIRGPSVVYGVAKVGKFEYREEPITKNSTQVYIRNIDFLFVDEGPIIMRDLSDKFRQGGKATLHLRGTLTRYREKDDGDKHFVSEETIDQLLNELEDSEPIPEERDMLTDFNEDSLQEYIANNFEKLDENIESIESEHPNVAGKADFYCETKNGKIKVIETKMGTAKHKAVSQLMSYMNGIREEENKEVSGILIAEGFGQKARYASKSDNIKLKRWKATIEFSDTN